MQAEVEMRVLHAPPQFQDEHNAQVILRIGETIYSMGINSLSSVGSAQVRMPHTRFMEEVAHYINEGYLINFDFVIREGDND